MHFDVIVVGGGAAGYFTAINVKEINPALNVAIFEQSKEVLNKVRISGGGRCNVTNSVWEPTELIKNYPRGEKELLGPFNKFSCGDTMAWFEDRGVPLKIEEDGRVFPVSDSSESFIDCFNAIVKKHKIKVITQAKVKSLSHENGIYKLLINENIFSCTFLVLTPGSSNYFWQLLGNLGYEIIQPVPSLFTFNIKDPRLKDLMGISVTNAEVKLEELKFSTRGPLLITHWGLSGPGILKLSAFAARELASLHYNFVVKVDWMPDFLSEDILKHKQNQGKKSIHANPLGNLPSRLWKSLINFTGISEDTKWADVNKEQMETLIDGLKSANFLVKGKSTFKDEFVTAGGVDLKQINFKTFGSKLHANLYMAGEVLNIDAITGGFNFQAAWTGAWIIASEIGNKS